MPEKGRDYTQEAVHSAKGSNDPQGDPAQQGCLPNP